MNALFAVYERLCARAMRRGGLGSRPVRSGWRPGPAHRAALVVASCALPAVPAMADAAIAWVHDTRGVGIALDASDNVYTVDYEQALGAEMSLTKRSASGDLQWVRSYDQTDSTAWERASWVATDSAGNAIVCGTRMSGYSNPVEAASIAMKFAPDGSLLWRKVYEGNFDGSSVRKCLVDADDNVYVFGMGSGPAGRVMKLKKFAPDGSALWDWFDTKGIGAALNAKLGPEGDVLVTGRGITGSINGYARIDPEGNTLWDLPGVSSLTAGDIAGDAFGHTYVLHGQYVTANPGTVVKKLGPTGTLLWEKTYSLSGSRIEVGSDGGIVVSGFPSAGSFGAAFLKLDPDGTQLWSNLDADGPLAVLAHAHMLLDPDNNAYLAAGTMSEMAVTRVNSDGTSGWTQTVAFGYAQAIAVANTDDSIYVVGGTTARIGQGAVPTLPAAPSNLRYDSLAATSAALRWTNNATDANGFTLERCTGTLLYCGATPAAWAVRTTTAADVNVFSDTGLAPGTAYAWRVRAFNGAGNSAYSNTLAATMPVVPAAPSELKAQAKIVKGRAQVRLAWLDNAANEAGYTVERCRDAGCTGFAAVATLPANARSHTDATVARATTYRYRVMATANGGNSAYSNAVTVRTP